MNAAARTRRVEQALAAVSAQLDEAVGYVGLTGLDQIVGTASWSVSADQWGLQLSIPGQSKNLVRPRVGLGQVHEEAHLDVRQLLDALVEALDPPSDEQIRRFVIYHPLLFSSLLSPADQDPNRTWAAATQLSVALTEIVGRWTATDAEARLLEPLAARTCFYLLAAPWRYFDRPPGELARRFAGGTLNSAPGWLAHYARQARQGWAQRLRTLGDHPLLFSWPADQIELEIERLVLHWPLAAGLRTTLTSATGVDLTHGGRPHRLVLHPTANPSPVEEEFHLRQVSDLLLPRFLVDQAATVLDEVTAERVASQLSERVRQSIRITPQTLVTSGPLATVSAAATAVVLAGLGASWLAVGLLLVIPAGVWSALIWLAGRAAGFRALLRLPAGVLLGLVPFLGVGVEKWAGTSTSWPVVLFALPAALAYLWYEATSHGSPPKAALVRAVGVGTVGLAYALLVTGTVLAFVGPAFVDHSRYPLELTSSSSLQPLLVAGSGALTLGVFLQVLWDREPITAPLARLEYRND